MAGVEVIGVVRDAPNQGLREPVAPAIYYPYSAALSDTAVLLVRTKGRPLVLAAVAGALLVTTLAAVVIPARRGISIEPIIALRTESIGPAARRLDEVAAVRHGSCNSWEPWRLLTSGTRTLSSTVSMSKNTRTPMETASVTSKA